MKRIMPQCLQPVPYGWSDAFSIIVIFFAGRKRFFRSLPEGTVPPKWLLGTLDAERQIWLGSASMYCSA
jgi:hypothetical protein